MKSPVPPLAEPKPEYEVRTHLARRDYVNGQLTDITVASLADYHDRSVCSAEGGTERDALDSLERKVLSMHAKQLSAVQKARYGGGR